MNRLCLVSGRFCHSLCSPPGWRCQQKIHSFTVEKANHSIDRRCLSGSGTSRQYHDPMLYRFHHGSSLHLIQVQFPMLLNNKKSIPKFPFFYLTLHIQIMKHPCHVHFHIIVSGWINPHGFFFLLEHNLLLDCKIHQIFFNIRKLNPQQLVRPSKKRLLLLKNMPVIHALQQCIKDTAADTEIRIRMNTNLCSNLICRLKSHSRHMVRDLVRVLLYDTVHTLPVMLVNLCSQSRRYSIFLEEYHCLAHIPLFFHLRRNLPCLSLADPLDFRQPFRLLLDDAERILFKFLHNLSRQ